MNRSVLSYFMIVIVLCICIFTLSGCSGDEVIENEYGKYVGEVKDGVPHGHGTLTDLIGGKYEGEFKNGLPNGHGTMTAPDGHAYEGEVRDGKRHGQGTLYSPDGDILQEGRWENGEYVGE